MDDPKDIAWIGPFYGVTMALVWLWPAAVSGAGFAVALAWRAEDPQRKQRLLEMLLDVMVLFGCFWFLRSDPLQVASWFAD